MTKEQHAKCVKLFAVAVSLIALAGGLSGSIMSNYFRDAYQVTALQRGFLETPRESGGILCVVLFAMLGTMGDSALGILAQLLMGIGLVGMGFLSPSYTVMIGFLFLYSMGQHLFMPVNDSISMSLAEHGKNGSALGHFKKYNDRFAMLAGALVFVGFKTGVFSFNTPIILPFAIALALTAVAAVLLWMLKREMPKKEVKNARFVVRKEYLPYYVTTFAFGFQKRIRIVYAPWILIELLSQGADTIAIMTLISRFVGSFTAPYVGKFMDKMGVKLSLRAEAAFLAFVCIFEGVLAGCIVGGTLNTTVCFLLACVGFVLGTLTDQCNMVHSLMMKKLTGEEHKEELSVSLSMGVSIDHVMAILVSPILGFIWTSVGPAWVFYVTALTVLVQLAVAQWLLPKELEKA